MLLNSTNFAPLSKTITTMHVTIAIRGEKNTREDSEWGEIWKRGWLSISINISTNFNVNDLLALHYAINTVTPSLSNMRKVWTRLRAYVRMAIVNWGCLGSRPRSLYLVPSDREKSTTKSYTTRGTKPTASAAAVAGCNNETCRARARCRANGRRVRTPLLISSARGTVNIRGVIITGASGLTETRGDESRDRSSIGLDARRRRSSTFLIRVSHTFAAFAIASQIGDNCLPKLP